MIIKMILILASLSLEAFAEGLTHAEAGIVRNTFLAQDAQAHLDMTKEVIKIAHRKNRSSRYIRAMARKLSTVQVWDAKDHEMCNEKENAAMRADLGGQFIYACPNFSNPWYSSATKVQMMLHEFAHLIGVTGEEECKADHMAREIMKLANLPLTKSGYDDMCLSLEGFY
jgi:hypothetical protein